MYNIALDAKAHIELLDRLDVARKNISEEEMSRGMSYTGAASGL